MGNEPRRAPYNPAPGTPLGDLAAMRAPEPKPTLAERARRRVRELVEASILLVVLSAYFSVELALIIAVLLVALGTLFAYLEE